MNPDSRNEVRIRPLRERLREETARVIAAAAEEVFAARGMRDAKVEEIAQRAGVSVGTVYNHFEDREALLAELLESRRQQLALKLDGALDVKGPFAAQLAEFMRTVFEHFEAHRQFLSIMLECDSARLEQPSPAMLEIRARIDALVARGVKQGALRKSDLWSAMLVGVIKSLLVHELRNPGKLAPAQRVEAAVDFFLNGARA